MTPMLLGTIIEALQNEVTPMLLGTIIEALQNEETAVATLLALGDIVLVAEVETARGVHEESVGGYIAGATQRFARAASDEDWLRLMTALERSSAPAATCLAAMVRWSIARDAEHAGAVETSHRCTCGGGDGSCHGQA